MATGVGRSGARPCDACGQQRAQWYCSADDAHLCNACDTQVHTANAVACRHDRVSLSTTTTAVRFPGAPLACWSSSWLRKRSRSGRRHRKSNPDVQQPLGSTPTTDAVLEDNADKEEASLSWLWSSDDVDAPLSWLCNHRVKSEPSEDVGYVKTELEPEGLLDLNFEFCLINGREMEKMKVHEESKVGLRLNYEEVLSAWSDRGSPWAQAQPVMYPLDDTTSDLVGDGGSSEFGLVPDLVSLGCGQSGRKHVIGQVPVMIHGGDGQRPRAGGREARVMRYREKRQSRLFNKKIRYHVRKLNAENRPRMKGRFVKRTADAPYESLAL